MDFLLISFMCGAFLSLPKTKNPLFKRNIGFFYFIKNLKCLEINIKTGDKEK